MSPKQWTTPPPMSIDPKKKYEATLHTEKGDNECFAIHSAARSLAPRIPRRENPSRHHYRIKP